MVFDILLMVSGAVLSLFLAIVYDWRKRRKQQPVSSLIPSLTESRTAHKTRAALDCLTQVILVPIMHYIPEPEKKEGYEPEEPSPNRPDIRPNERPFFRPLRKPRRLHPTEIQPPVEYPGEFPGDDLVESPRHPTEVSFPGEWPGQFPAEHTVKFQNGPVGQIIRRNYDSRF